MSVGINNADINSKPVNECYFIINRKQQIVEAHFKKCSFFPFCKKIIEGKSIDDVFTGDYSPIGLGIKAAINEENISMFESVIKNIIKIEVKVYPSNENSIVIIKDRTKETLVEELIADNNKKLSFFMEASCDIVKSNKPKEILDSLFNRLSSYLDLDYYFNYILDPDKQKIRLMNYYGIPENTAQQIEWLEFGEAVCGTVAQIQKRIIAEHIQTSENPKVQLIKGWGVKAYACHPLFSHGKLLGTLSFGSSKRETFTSDEIDLIFNICQQVALSLERAFLITELEDKNKALQCSNQELMLANEQSEKANKAKTDFLLLMSHEFRTPLNSIIGFNQILLSTKGPDAFTKAQRTYLEKMMMSSKQLQQMINDILDFVRHDSAKLTLETTEVDLNRIIEDCIREISPFAKIKRVTINNKKIKSDDIQIYTDEKRLRQVLRNLLSNAIKYNKKEGTVLVSSYTMDNLLIIKVSDTGTGIEEGELDQICKPFYRSPSNNPAISGSGIGLPLSKRIINELGGTLTVSSAKGEGSTFTISLPLI